VKDFLFMPAVDSQIDPATLNAMFESAPPRRIVEWAMAQFGDGLVMSSSFGAESAVLLHMATRLAPAIKVIFVNTGYLFPQTHRFMEQLRLRLNLNVWIYRTANDPIAYLHRAGEANPSWRSDINACCAANKNEPFERALKELAPSAWLRGIRRDQASTRRAADFVERFERYDCWAVSPLLNWGSREIHAYLKQHDLPYHPLVEKGYASIGCNPLSCTRPIGPGEDPRSARWAGRDKVECGINLASLDDANKI
jgi:phosphoadenosine phosphosulfate reductase